MREVPSLESERRHGASNLRAFRDGWRVLRTIFSERLRRQRATSNDWRPEFSELAQQPSWHRPRELSYATN